MWSHIYVSEKLRELEAEQQLRGAMSPAPPKKKPVVGPLARRTGRTLRRIGEGLEAWGSAPPVRETDPA